MIKDIQVFSINDDTINLFEEMMVNPKKHNIDIKPLKEVFIHSDKIISSNDLYKQYTNYIKHRPLPKVVFYIVMTNVFGDPLTTNKDGKIVNAGYHLTINPNL